MRALASYFSTRIVFQRWRAGNRTLMLAAAISMRSGSSSEGSLCGSKLRSFVPIGGVEGRVAGPPEFPRGALALIDCEAVAPGELIEPAECGLATIRVLGAILASAEA